MRTIKFRGKTINGNEWIFGTTISQGTIKRKMNKWFMEVGENKWKGLQPNSLGQFTGLLDKNDKEIYEGDILVWGEGEHKSKPLIVSFKHGSFGYIYCDWFHSFAGNTNFTFNPLNTDVRFEIIGNIHDNIELLTKK